MQNTYLCHFKPDSLNQQKYALPRLEKVHVVLPNFRKILLLEVLSSPSPPMEDNVLPQGRTCPPGPKVRIVVYGLLTIVCYYLYHLFAVYSAMKMKM